MNSSSSTRSRAAWAVIGLLLAVETLLLGWVLVVTILATIASDGAVAQNVSLVIVAAASLAWIAITLVGAIRSRSSWVRGSTLTIHVLLFAAGTGCLQLLIGPWWFGFALVAVALLGFAAAILARPEERASAEAGAE